MEMLPTLDGRSGCLHLLWSDELTVDEALTGQDEGHHGGSAVEDAPVRRQALHDLEDQIERVLTDAGALGDIGA